MSKAQVLRRNFSLFNRIPHSQIARAAARDGYDSVAIQRVRIRRPFFRNSRLVGGFAIVIATYCVGRALGLEVEVSEIKEGDNRSVRNNGHSKDAEGWQIAGEEQDEEDDDDDVLLFLPTGLSRPKPKTFYRGSDPEWQEFRKIATDRPRAERIRAELTKLVRDTAVKTPGYAARIGTVDPNKGNRWIEFQFPYSPPVEYERPGVELTDGLEWRRTTRPVETAHHHRLHRLLYPTNVANALYADTKSKANAAWKSFRDYLGIEKKPENVPLQTMFEHAVVATSGTPSPGLSPSSSSPSPSTTQTPVSADSPPSVQNAAKDLGVPLPLPHLSSLVLDLKKFQQEVQKSSKPAPQLVPRGAFYVLGLIEIYGERSRLTLNVTAVYDPKQGRYVALGAKVWNLSEHRQLPQGGR